MSESKVPAGLDAPNDKGSDWMLQDLVLVAEAGSEIGVTLFLHGMAVTGLITSGRRYTELLVDSMPEQSEATKDYFRDNAEVQDNLDTEGDGPHFIHLREARAFFAQNAFPSGKQAMLWRGKISEVVGFMIGTIG